MDLALLRSWKRTVLLLRLISGPSTPWSSTGTQLRFASIITALSNIALPSFFSFCQEGGLLGSQAVARHYEQNGAHVLGMSQVIQAVTSFIIVWLMLA